MKPKLVAQVKFTEWTDDNKLRHPTYLGMRDDKKPQEVVREETPQYKESVLQRLPDVAQRRATSDGDELERGATSDEPRQGQQAAT